MTDGEKMISSQLARVISLLEQMQTDKRTSATRDEWGLLEASGVSLYDYYKERARSLPRLRGRKTK